MKISGDSSDRAHANARFCTTRWSVVAMVGQQGDPMAWSALNDWCSHYWYPLYAFARRKGNSPEEAQDLTQGYFALLLDKNTLHAADRDRGRFRTYLLATFENFLQNEWTKQRTLKRGGGITFVAWQADEAETRYQQEPIDGRTPEKIFELRWAMSLLETVLGQLRAEFTRAGKTVEFETLEVFLSGEKHPACYAQIAGKLERSEGAVRVAVHRLRTRYGELLRHAIAETLTDPSEVDDELNHLFAILSG